MTRGPQQREKGGALRLKPAPQETVGAVALAAAQERQKALSTLLGAGCIECSGEQDVQPDGTILCPLRHHLLMPHDRDAAARCRIPALYRAIRERRMEGVARLLDPLTARAERAHPRRKASELGFTMMLGRAAHAEADGWVPLLELVGLTSISTPDFEARLKDWPEEHRAVLPSGSSVKDWPLAAWYFRSPRPRFSLPFILRFLRRHHVRFQGQVLWLDAVLEVLTWPDERLEAEQVLLGLGT